MTLNFKPFFKTCFYVYEKEKRLYFEIITEIIYSIDCTKLLSFFIYYYLLLFIFLIIVVVQTYTLI